MRRECRPGHRRPGCIACAWHSGRQICGRGSSPFLTPYINRPRADGAQDTGQKFASLGDLKLESGEILRDCRIGYRTFGRLDASKSALEWAPLLKASMVELSGDCGHIATGCEAPKVAAALTQALR